MRKCILAAGLLILGGPLAPGVYATTGNFTSPLTSGLVVSSDINGGPLTTAQPFTEGFVTAGVRPVPADPFGVSWIGWGGQDVSFGGGDTGGDGVQLPCSQSSPVVNAASFTKSNFGGGISATVSTGTPASYNSTSALNSRDRGGQSNANDGFIFRDLVFGATSGSNVQGTNYVQLKVSGLTVGASYQIAAYSYDGTGAHTTNWTAVAPTTSLGTLGFWDGTGLNNNFTAPVDEQSISWTSGGPFQAPAVFTETADGTGSVTVWGWGGNGVTGNQSADTSYVNGFQVALVPEPASLGLIGLAAASLVGRRRRA